MQVVVEDVNNDQQVFIVFNDFGVVFVITAQLNNMAVVWPWVLVSVTVIMIMFGRRRTCG